MRCSYQFLSHLKKISLVDSQDYNRCTFGSNYSIHLLLSPFKRRISVNQDGRPRHLQNQASVRIIYKLLFDINFYALLNFNSKFSSSSFDIIFLSFWILFVIFKNFSSNSLSIFSFSASSPSVLVSLGFSCDFKASSTRLTAPSSPSAFTT